MRHRVRSVVGSPVVFWGVVDEVSAFSFKSGTWSVAKPLVAYGLLDLRGDFRTILGRITRTSLQVQLLFVMMSRNEVEVES
jgi:hypothetical protein